MPNFRTCLECGILLPEDALNRLCPVCALRGALALSGGESAGIPLNLGGCAGQPGDQIGPYKLVSTLGQGGFGMVFLAEQTEPLRRRVALKIIKPGMDTRQVIARFEAERHALARMDHPGIAKVFEAGSTATGRPYFVMELVEGPRITDFCRQNELSIRARLELFGEVCRAVQHAHQKGIIHRDLKPSNILVAMQDGKPVPKVIDFGIAKATQEPLTEETIWTSYGQFLGTPAYMSPEQAGLGGMDVDTRTDIYALGVLLYELLTGCIPFEKPELLRAGLEEMRRLIRETEPPKPSTKLGQELVAAGKVGRVAPRAPSSDEINSKSGAHGVTRPAVKTEEEARSDPRRLAQIKELIPQVRGELDWIVMKCLEKDRARRYESASGLALDVERHLHNEPVSAAAPGALYRVRKFARRHRVSLAVSATFILLLVSGVVASTWEAVRAIKAEQQQALLRKQAETAQAASRTEAAKSRQVAKFLTGMLNGVGPSVALGRDTRMLHEILDKTADRVGKDLKGQPEAEGELRNTIGNVYAELGDYPKAGDMLRQALALRKSVFGEKHLLVADSLQDLGALLKDQGKPAEAEAMFRQALAMRRELLGNENADVASSLDAVGVALLQEGEPAKAEAIHREALALRKKLFGDEHVDVAISMHNLANVLLTEGKNSEAETVFRQVIALRKKLLGNEHPLVAGTLANLGTVLMYQNKFAEAETAYREALAMQRKLMGDGHPDVATSLHNLACILLRESKLSEAETLGRQAQEIRRKLLGAENPEYASTLGLMATIYLREGKFPEAEALQREALPILQKRLGL